MTRVPHPYVASRFELELELVRRSRQPADVAPVPEGYALRLFRDGDDAAYEALFRLAWPDEGTLAHTRQLALHEGFFVVEQEATRELVGSCVAFAPEQMEHGRDGSLGWLVVDPAHGRRGLGALLAATVTNRLLAEDYAQPWLRTEDDRLVAINLYLSLGWQPHLYASGMDERWREIFERLRTDGA